MQNNSVDFKTANEVWLKFEHQTAIFVIFDDQLIAYLVKSLWIISIEILTNFHMLVYVKVPSPRRGRSCFSGKKRYRMTSLCEKADCHFV